jgi:hypothetical protein
VNETAVIPELLEFADTRPQLDVQEAEYQRLLGFPREHALGERSRELAAWAREWYEKHGRPWIYARAAGGLELDADKFRLGTAEFASERLGGQFLAARAHDAVLVAVSAGPECEEKARECWREGKPDEYFFMEMFGSAVVEHLVTLAAGRICAWADQGGIAVLPHYSPGYTGWPVSDQLKLWGLIRENSGVPFPADLEVMHTGMLRPKKSLLAVFGLTRHAEKVRNGSRLIPCENCSLPGCQYRRAPYRHFMPQTESVAIRGPDAARVGAKAADGVDVLDHNARYSVNARALERWARERLRLEVAGDGFVHASFRYDGTTCANLGRAVHYEYRVRLHPRREAYRVAEMNCAPADGDTGHASMCEYLKDPEGFMRQVEAEKPLLGCPLNEVLAWKRSSNPAGCNCEAGSREHKWGIVFEVIHFALAQNGQKNIDSAGEPAKLAFKS